MAFLLPILVAASLPWQSAEATGPSRGTITREYLAGFGAAAAFGLAGAACISSVYTLHGGEPKVTGLDPLGYGLLAAMPVAAAITTTLVDLGSDPRGSAWGAVAGSYAGALVGGGLFYGTLSMRGTIGNEPHCIAGILAPFIVAGGAVLGYEFSRPCPSCRDWWLGDRLEMPALALDAAGEGPGLALGMKVVSLRF